MTDSIYKIFTLPEWDEFVTLREFSGSVDDQRDGFIHFSTRPQLQGTLDKHYKTQEKVVIARFDPQALGPELRWEMSRGGQKFPHLYAKLSWQHMDGHLQIERQNDQYNLDELDKSL